MINTKPSTPRKRLSLCCGLLLFCSTFFSSAHGSQESTLKTDTKLIRLASTVWCPYICNDKNNPGFIVEYLRDSLADYNIDLEISVLPWSRAIYMAQIGAIDGLLTATKVEAPGLLFTKAPTGSYQMCFYSRGGDKFLYSDRNSLINKRLGAVKDYGYGEPIDSMISQPIKHEKVLLLATSKPLHSLVGMLETSRIDLFIEDKNVVQKYLNESPKKYHIRKAGCLESVPFYTAISPKIKNGQQLIEELNFMLSSDAARARYQSARSNYGIDESN